MAKRKHKKIILKGYAVDNYKDYLTIEDKYSTTCPTLYNKDTLRPDELNSFKLLKITIEEI